MSSWPDTTGVARPRVDDAYHTARWLVGRHPVLAQLLARVMGVIDWEDDGPWVALEALEKAIRGVDAYNVAWEDYRKRTWEPQDEDRWAAWRTAGPNPEDFAAPGVVHSIIVMSRTEQARLRLLATIGGRVEFSVGDLQGFDEAGQRLVADWCTVVMAQ